MEVEVRLFANLRQRLPDAPRGRGRLTVSDGASLQELLDVLVIPPEQAQMVLVNGEKAPRERAAREAIRLAAGDSIAIFPPLAGG
jgi:molybdopterin converting factor small subunit